MAFVMGIVTMICMTRNMTRKIIEAALYGKINILCGAMMKVPTISSNKYMAMFVVKKKEHGHFVFWSKVHGHVEAHSIGPAMPPKKKLSYTHIQSPMRLKNSLGGFSNNTHTNFLLHIHLSVFFPSKYLNYHIFKK